MTTQKEAAPEAVQTDEQVNPSSDVTDEQNSQTTKVEKPEAVDEDSQQLKAALVREREARKKAEQKAAESAFKLREKKHKKTPTDNMEEAQNNDFEQLLEVRLAKEREEIRKELFSERARDIVNSFSDNSDERELILEMHKNRSFPQHLSLEEQLEECFIVANKKKILGENNELKRALAGKQGVSRDSATTHQEKPQSGEPKLSSADAMVIQQAGFKWNGTSRRYEKKLPNGSLLVKDLKTGQTSIV